MNVTGPGASSGVTRPTPKPAPAPAPATTESPASKPDGARWSSAPLGARWSSTPDEGLDVLA